MLDNDTCIYRNAKAVSVKAKIEYLSEITESYSWEKERELLNWSNYSREFLGQSRSTNAENHIFVTRNGGYQNMA